MDKWQVVYYVTSSGDSPVSDFLDTLPSSSQTKLLRIFDNIVEYGLQSVIPHIKKLSGTPFWEIRVLGNDNVRVIYVVPTKMRILALHGFTKKSQKTPPKELQSASKRYSEYLSRKK